MSVALRACEQFLAVAFAAGRALLFGPSGMAGGATHPFLKQR
jgi:hypothetical protein